MRMIGLLGGMSWESTAIYYRLANEFVRDRLGGLHSANILMRSVDFAEIEALQFAGDWDAAGELLVDAARSLEGAGAELIVLCTNTMHKVAPAIEMLIDQSHTDALVFPTTQLHVRAAVDAALRG